MGDSGRSYTVSFDTAKLQWMCSCPQCTRRRVTCKHIEGLSARDNYPRGGPDSLPLSSPPPPAHRCPICEELCINAADLATHVVQDHGGGQERGMFRCICGFTGSRPEVGMHMLRQDDLIIHIAEQRLRQ